MASNRCYASLEQMVTYSRSVSVLSLLMCFESATLTIKTAGICVAVLICTPQHLVPAFPTEG